MPVTEYIWDDVNDCVLEECDETGATQVTYTHEPGPFGPLISETRGGVESYHHYDALGSTTMLTNDTGSITDTFQYDAWGNQFGRTGTTQTPYTWCGKWGYQDDTSTTGGYYIRARLYQPQLARWTSVDPIRDLTNSSQSQSPFSANSTVEYISSRIAAPSWLPNHSTGFAHAYTYVMEAPTNSIDPSGLWRFVDGMGFLSGTFGPGETETYGNASSEFILDWRPNAGRFKSHVDRTCCEMVSFVQIFYMDIKAYGFTSLPNRKWTMDPYRWSTPPFYPDGTTGNPNQGVASTLFDSPHFRRLFQYARPSSLSMDWETCAVCSQGKSKGDVYACVRWGHSFQIAGTIFNAHITGWKRYVESDAWTDGTAIIGQRNNPQHAFRGIMNLPTSEMTPFLDEYFH